MKNAEESFGIDERVVHIIENALQLRNRGYHIAEQHHVIHNLSYTHTGIIDENQIGRKDDDEHGTDLFHKTLKSVVIETTFGGR